MASKAPRTQDNRCRQRDNTGWMVTKGLDEAVFVFRAVETAREMPSATQPKAKGISLSGLNSFHSIMAGKRRVFGSPPQLEIEKNLESYWAVNAKRPFKTMPEVQRFSGMKRIERPSRALSRAKPSGRRYNSVSELLEKESAGKPREFKALLSKRRAPQVAQG